jgi:hypothetical protein
MIKNGIKHTVQEGLKNFYQKELMHQADGRAVSRHTRDLVWQPLLQWAVLGIINLVMAFTSFRLLFGFYHAIFI